MFVKMILLLVIGLSSSLAFAGADDEAYFKQFLYRKEQTGNDPDYPTYIYWILDSDALTPIPIGNNQQVILMTSIEMRDDHTYTMMYQDGVGLVGAQTWNPRYCMTIVGTWSVPDKSLILKDASGKSIMQGDRFFKNNQNAVTFKYLADFPATEMVNLNGPYGMAQSNTEPSMTCFIPNPPHH